MEEHNHSELCTCGKHLTTYGKLRQYDPTHTVTLRNAFVSQMDKRFNRLCNLIIQAVVDRDCFGLKPQPTIFQELPVERAFAFSTSQEKVQGFMKWLQEQVDRGILTVTEMEQVGEAVRKEWTDLYIEDSYKRGVIRARYEMIRAGWNVPSIEAAGGIAMVMTSAPFHVDRLGLLFTRTYNELKGVTDAMDQQLSRVLAQGIADGDGPRLIARKMVGVITGRGEELGIKDSLGRWIPAKRRAEILARTEIIRAHHVATIQEYRNWGVVGVHVKAEWSTAGDSRVCEQCASLEGKIFTLDEIEPMIPLHPNCRCISLPVLEK
jgi:SPP1 gp7 family putative phage head morphogenesis protein